MLSTWRQDEHERLHQCEIYINTRHDRFHLWITAVHNRQCSVSKPQQHAHMSKCCFCFISLSCPKQPLPVCSADQASPPSISNVWISDSLFAKLLHCYAPCSKHTGRRGALRPLWQLSIQPHRVDIIIEVTPGEGEKVSWRSSRLCVCLCLCLLIQKLLEDKQRKHCHFSFSVSSCFQTCSQKSCFLPTWASMLKTK